MTSSARASMRRPKAKSPHLSSRLGALHTTGSQATNRYRPTVWADNLWASPTKCGRCDGRLLAPATQGRRAGSLVPFLDGFLVILGAPGVTPGQEAPVLLCYSDIVCDAARRAHTRSAVSTTMTAPSPKLESQRLSIPPDAGRNSSTRTPSPNAMPATSAKPLEASDHPRSMAACRPVRRHASREETRASSLGRLSRCPATTCDLL
jgi:hypothetical protein